MSRGQTGDLFLLGRQMLTGLDRALSSPFTSGPELDASALGKRFRAHRLEHVVSAAERSTGVDPPILAAQPFAVEEMCTGEVRGDVSGLEMRDSPLVEVFGLRIGGE